MGSPGAVVSDAGAGRAIVSYPHGARSGAGNRVGGPCNRHLGSSLALSAERGHDPRRTTSDPGIASNKVCMPTTERARPGLAYVLLPLASLCWSGNHVVGRAVAGDVPPVALNTLRWAIVALLAGMIGARTIRRDWPAIRANGGRLIFFGLLGCAAFGTLQFVGLKYTTAINVGVMNSLAPAFIAAASFIIFRDWFSGRQAAGLAISLLGVLAIVSGLDPGRLAQLEFNIGDLIILVNMMLWGVYSACLRRRPPIAATSFLFAQSLIAALAMLPAAAAEHLIWEPFHSTPAAWGAIAYSAVLSSLVAYLCWGRGVELIGASRAGAFLHLIPIFNAVLAGTLLGETLGLHHAAGFMLILGGVTMVAGGRK